MHLIPSHVMTYAQSAPAPGGAGLGQLIFMVAVFFGAFYMFAIRPQNMRRKEQANMSTNLKPGDEVLTFGGFIGIVSENDPEAEELTIELSPGVPVRVVKSAIARKILPPLPDDWEPEDLESEAADDTEASANDASQDAADDAADDTK